MVVFDSAPFPSPSQQVEHHLFPALSHGALRKLTPVIRRVCRQHGVHFK